MPKIKLQFPINHNDKLVDSIEFPDRVKLKHLKAMDSANGDIGKIAALIGVLADLPAYAVDQIDAEDLDAISNNEVFAGFLDRAPATGSK